MARYKKDINSIYISERMQEILRQIREHSITSIVAPMGYGKTTAALWYSDERKERGDEVFRVNIYSADVSLFWNTFCSVFSGTVLGERLNGMSFPRGSTAVNMVIEAFTEYLNLLSHHIYIFIDDCHLINDNDVFCLIYSLCDIPTEKLHFILASRSAVVKSGEELHLGNRLLKISAEDLRLNKTELSNYCRRCGINLPEDIENKLFERSEGWFSFIYLNIYNFQKNGVLLDKADDIYSMIGDTLFSTYTDEEKAVLTDMCIADEFTVEQAIFVTENKNAGKIIENVSRNNAFIRFLTDTATYRIHHMLRTYLEYIFDLRSEKEKKEKYLLYGKFHENNEYYSLAVGFYEMADEMRLLLRVIAKDRGIQIVSFKPEKVLEIIEKCSEDDLINEPEASLVLMRRLFSWHQIPKMLEFKEIILKSVAREGLSTEDRNNILGECDLIMSFLGYNDISAMSKLHRRAGLLMTRNAISISAKGSWTFGSPSVLMMFHRATGNLNSEIEEMNVSMPFYYKVAHQQGMGAEFIMQAEAFFNCGDFTNARISVEKARVAAESKEQEYMVLCCDFLKLRLDYIEGKLLTEEWKKIKYDTFKKNKDPMILNVLDGAVAYYYAMVGELKNVPEWLLNGKLSDNSILNPARPMYEVIYNQILLAQKDFISVVARGDSVLELCRIFPYTLCEIHLHIQLAGAFLSLGKEFEAKEEMRYALKLALPDKIIAPFAENGKYILRLLDSTEFKNIPEVQEIKRIYFETPKTSYNAFEHSEKLTKREQIIAELISVGKIRREISAELFISENTVRNHINNIYNKLHLTGTPKQKQQTLVRLLSQKEK